MRGADKTEKHPILFLSALQRSLQRHQQEPCPITTSLESEERHVTTRHNEASSSVFRGGRTAVRLEENTVGQPRQLGKMKDGLVNTKGTGAR